MNTQYEVSLKAFLSAFDMQIERVEDVRAAYAQHPTGTVAILTTIAPALQAAKEARESMDVEAMREAFEALRTIA